MKWLDWLKGRRKPLWGKKSFTLQLSQARRDPLDWQIIISDGDTQNIVVQVLFDADSGVDEEMAYQLVDAMANNFITYIRSEKATVKLMSDLLDLEGGEE